jgi:hypothetical protein
MKATLKIEGEVTVDGHLLIKLPSELPHGRVLVTLEPLPEDSLELREEDLKGSGLTAEEIAASSGIGAWAGNETQSGAEYVEQIRRAAPRYSW